MKPSNFAASFTLSALAALLLAGCGKSDAKPAAEAAPAASIKADGASYEMVQLEREDPPNTMVALAREMGYKPCAEITSKVLKKPVKPFPEIPLNHGDRRITTTTNGKSHMVKIETYYDTIETGGPEQGCEYKLKPNRQVSIQIYHAGRVVDLLGDQGATPSVTSDEETVEIPAFALKPSDTSDYSEKRTVNGVPLRCLPQSHVAMSKVKGNGMHEMCVYAVDGVIVDRENKATVVRSHAFLDIMDPKFAAMTKLEPLSVRRIGKEEPNPYLASTYTSAR